MKTKLALILVALSSAASATTITAAGGTGGALFTTSTGSTLTAANTSITAGSLVGNLFTAFSPSDASPIDISTVANVNFFGKWAGDTSDISAAANAFNSAQIWFRVAVDLGGGATGTAYFSGGQLFPVNNNGVGDGISINSNTLTTLGAPSSEGSRAWEAGDNRLIVGVVPEPSVALLGALGVFGLVRRRR